MIQIGSDSSVKGKLLFTFLQSVFLSIDYTYKDKDAKPRIPGFKAGGKPFGHFIDPLSINCAIPMASIPLSFVNLRP